MYIRIMSSVGSRVPFFNVLLRGRKENEKEEKKLEGEGRPGEQIDKYS